MQTKGGCPGRGLGPAAVAETCRVGSGEETESHSENNQISKRSHAGWRWPLSVLGIDGLWRVSACRGRGNGGPESLGAAGVVNWGIWPEEGEKKIQVYFGEEMLDSTFWTQTKEELRMIPQGLALAKR